MAIETQTVLERINTVFNEFTQQVNIEKEEVKRLGTATGETTQRIERLEAQISELELKLKRPMQQLGALGQPTMSEEKAMEIAERKRIFFKILRQNGTNGLEDTEKQIANEHKMRSIGAGDAKALALGDDTLGGFLAPPEYTQDIIKGVQLISPIRQIAKVRPTSRRSIYYPVRSGTFAAQWVGETQQRTETQGLKYSMEEISTYEMYAEVIVSEQDLEDSLFDLAAEIQSEASEQFAKAEGAAFVNGDSIKKPEGFMQNAFVTSKLSGNAGTIASAAVGSAGAGNGLIDFVYSLKSAYVQGATLVLNRKSVGAVRKLADTQGRPIWEPSYQTGTGPTGPAILGIPYVETPDMPDEGAANFPIALGNFQRAYLIVDRVDMVIKRLNEKYAEQGQIAFIVRKRVGGQVVLPEAIIKYKSNNS